MCDVSELLPSFANEPWEFFIDEYGANGARIRTYLEDDRVFVGSTAFSVNAACFSALVMRDDDRWRWEADSTSAEDTGIVDTLADAVAAAEAAMKRTLSEFFFTAKTSSVCR